MVRAWAAPHCIRHVPVHSPTGQVSGRLPSRARSCSCIGRPGSRRRRRFELFPISYVPFPLESSSTCVEVDPAGATQTQFNTFCERVPVCQLPGAPSSVPQGLRLWSPVALARATGTERPPAFHTGAPEANHPFDEKWTTGTPTESIGGQRCSPSSQRHRPIAALSVQPLGAGVIRGRLPSVPLGPQGRAIHPCS
jgi:hypothetical protein